VAFVIYTYVYNKSHASSKKDTYIYIYEFVAWLIHYMCGLIHSSYVWRHVFILCAIHPVFLKNTVIHAILCCKKSTLHVFTTGLLILICIVYDIWVGVKQRMSYVLIWHIWVHERGNDEREWVGKVTREPRDILTRLITSLVIVSHHSLSSRRLERDSLVDD